MTYGGFVEFVWPDELDTISADASTGAFINPNVGLASVGGAPNALGVSAGRQQSIAWERQQDLLELFHNNGMVYNAMGEPVLRGRIMMLYDRGLFTGFFSTFQVDEDDAHPFSFQLTWEFRVEATIYKFPSSLFPTSGTQQS